MNHPIQHLTTVPVQDSPQRRRRTRSASNTTVAVKDESDLTEQVPISRASRRTLTKAVITGGSALAACLVLTGIPLRLIVGPDWWADAWLLVDQLAFAQLIATWFAIFLATTFGMYAVEQLDLGRRGERAAEVRDEQRRREQREFDLVRLREALITLRHSLMHNRDQLGAGKGLTQILVEGKAPWEPQLDTATWDAVQSDVVFLLHDPELSAALAVHFDNIRSIAERVDRYFQFKLGGYQHVGNSGSTTDALRNYLLDRMAALDAEAANVDAQLAKVIDPQGLTV